MRLDTVQDLLLSPCCGSGLRLAPGETKSGGKVLWDGIWTCAACRRSYPQRGGIAFLCSLDRDWDTPLGELIARRRITQRLLEQLDWEPDRKRLHECQVATNRSVMDHLFDAAIRTINPRPGMRILDVGAGMCSTSAAFARRGAEVVATETEVSNLFHVSFEETTPGEPEILDTPLITFHSFNPEKYPDYFSRVVAPAHRLPLRSGSFDVVFCRSVLHHLDRLPHAISEMLRVLKPGGRFVACSEPTRSVLDDENHYLAGTVDKEDGMNEQTPRLTDYLLGLRVGSRDTEVQVWPNPHRFESTRLFGKIPYNFHRHVPPGSIARGWKIAKLLPFSASVNIMAKRDLSPLPLPPPTADLCPEFDAAALAAAYEPSSTVLESLRRLPPDTARLSSAWRCLLETRTGISSSFVPGIIDERELRVGWRTAVVRDGVLFRYANRTAEFLLRHPGKPGWLEMCVDAAPPAQAAPPRPCRGFVQVNGEEVGRFEVSAAGWQQLTFPLPAGTGHVLETEIVHESMPLSLIGGEPVDLGLAVRWARVI